MRDEVRGGMRSDAGHGGRAQDAPRPRPPTPQRRERLPVTLDARRNSPPSSGGHADFGLRQPSIPLRPQRNEVGADDDGVEIARAPEFRVTPRALKRRRRPQGRSGPPSLAAARRGPRSKHRIGRSFTPDEHYSAGTRRREAARGGFWQGAAKASARRRSRSATSRPEAELRRRQNAASGRPQQTSSSAVVLGAIRSE